MAGIFLSYWCHASPAAAQGASPAPGGQPEELAPVMARRISAHLGRPVRIKDLRYELLTSRFVGQGVEVGPRRAPILTITQISLKPRILPSEKGGQVIEQLQISGLKAVIPGAWLSRPVPRSLGREVQIKAGKILGSRITIRGKGGASVILRGVELTLSDLHLPAGAKGRAPLWRGAFSLTAQSVDIEEITLNEVRMEGVFRGEKLAIALLSGKLKTSGLEGGFKLKGDLGFSGGRPGALSLAGRVELLGGSEGGNSIQGPITLKGRSWDSVQLKVKLKSSRRIAPSRGSMKPAPLLKMRGKVGGRTLRGTLESWRLK